MVKALCMGNQCGKRTEGRPMRRWLDNAENGLKLYGHQKIEAEGYQMEWTAIVKEAKAMQSNNCIMGREMCSYTYQAVGLEPEWAIPGA